MTANRRDVEPIEADAQARRAMRGFSLLEILVVLAIMGVLATFVAPRLFNQVDRSKIVAATAQARSLKTSLDAFRLDVGRFPTSEEGLAVLVTAPQNPSERANWFGPYVDGDIPVDPWGNPYRYVVPTGEQAAAGARPRIVSYGADNQEGGEGMNADIEI